jgi:hypothetical protein
VGIALIAGGVGFVAGGPALTSQEHDGQGEFRPSRKEREKDGPPEDIAARAVSGGVER